MYRLELPLLDSLAAGQHCPLHVLDRPDEESQREFSMYLEAETVSVSLQFLLFVKRQLNSTWAHCLT